MATLGDRLIQIRTERRQTLRAVAGGTGLAESFLSKLEHDKVNISVTNLKKLADFYGVPMTYFFEPELPHPVAYVIRAGQRLRLHHSAGAPQVEVIVPTFGTRLEATVAVAQPGEQLASSEPAPEPAAEGEQFHLVLAGRVRYHVGSEEYELGPGDTIYHATTTPFTWEALPDTGATVLGVRTPPT